MDMVKKMAIPNTENVVTPEGEIPKQFSMIQTREWIIERQRKNDCWLSTLWNWKPLSESLL